MYHQEGQEEGSEQKKLLIVLFFYTVVVSFVFKSLVGGCLKISILHR